jgi:hypothetical protein
MCGDIAADIQRIHYGKLSGADDLGNAFDCHALQSLPTSDLKGMILHSQTNTHITRRLTLSHMHPLTLGNALKRL